MSQPKIETLLREHRILTAFNAGRTIAQIAAAENLTPTYVRRALKRYGILGPGARPRPSPTVAARLADADWLAAEYAAKNIPQIAAELGATVGQVIGALKRAGIPRRGKREAMALTGAIKWSPELEEQAVALYRGGMTIKAVAREIGLSRASVQALLAKRGLTRSPREARLLHLAQQRTPQT